MNIKKLILIVSTILIFQINIEAVKDKSQKDKQISEIVYVTDNCPHCKDYQKIVWHGEGQTYCVTCKKCNKEIVVHCKISYSGRKEFWPPLEKRDVYASPDYLEHK